jgi:outer membrane protein assembly factor BamE
VVWFEGDVLKTIEAPDLPSEREFVQAISVARKRPEPPVLELTEAQRKALPAAPARGCAGRGPAAAGAVRSYPPLGD